MKFPKKSYFYYMFANKLIIQHTNIIHSNSNINKNYPISINQLKNNNDKNNVNIFEIVKCIHMPINSNFKYINNNEQLFEYFQDKNIKYGIFNVILLDIYPKNTKSLIQNASINNYIKNTDLTFNSKIYSVDDYFCCIFKVRFKESDNKYFYIYFTTFNYEGIGLLGINPLELKNSINYSFFSLIQQSINNLIGKNKTLELCIIKSHNNILKIVGEYNNLCNYNNPN